MKALRKVYGDEEQEAGAQPFGKADEQALKSMGGEEKVRRPLEKKTAAKLCSVFPDPERTSVRRWS